MNEAQGVRVVVDAVPDAVLRGAGGEAGAEGGREAEERGDVALPAGEGSALYDLQPARAAVQATADESWARAREGLLLDGQGEAYARARMSGRRAPCAQP